MINIDYGHIELHLKEIMEKQGVSLNKLAFRAEMQRTQLKAYVKNEIQRVDMSVLARLCYALECDLEDLITYIPPKNK